MMLNDAKQIIFKFRIAPQIVFKVTSLNLEWASRWYLEKLQFKL